MANKIKNETVNDKVLENLGGDVSGIKDTDKVVETKIEEPKEEIKIEEPKIETPQIDVEKLTADLKDQVTKDVQEKIVKSLNDDKPKQDKYDQFVSDYKSKNGEAPEWKIMADFIKEEAKSELNAEIEAENKKQEELDKANQEAQKQRNEALNKYWDNQETELEQAGKLQAIKVTDINDPNFHTDPGRVARVKLFEKMRDVNEERKAKGLPETYSLKDILFDYPDVLSNQPAGADAPISRGTRTVTPTNSNSFTYSDLKPGQRFGKFLKDLVGQ